MKEFRLIFIILLLLAASAAWGQSSASVYWNIDGLAPLVDDGDFQLRLSEFGAEFNYAIRSGQPDRLIVSANYHLLSPHFVLPLHKYVRHDGQRYRRSDFINDNHLEAPLHKVGAAASLFRFINRNWALGGELEVGLAGDYCRPSADEILVRPGVGAIWEKNPDLNLSFGAVLVEVLDPFYFLPYFGWLWSPKDWFVTQARAPLWMDFTFIFLDRLETTVFQRLDYGKYFVGENELDLDRFKYLNLRLGGRLGFQIVGPLWLTLEAGGSPYWRFTGEDDQGDEILAGDYRFNWFAGAALSLRSFSFK